MFLRRLSHCLMLSVVLATVARADVIVNVGDLSLPQGSSGLLPVMITGTSGQVLNQASFELQISTGGVTRLSFADSSIPDPSFGAANYVFFGNSADQSVPIGLGSAQKVNFPNDTFNGGDLANNGANVDVSTGSFLLGYIPVTTLTALPPVVGDTFTVSLISGVNTRFSGNDSGPFAFSSTAGTVTIIAATVPEPSACILALTGAIGLAILCRRALGRRGLGRR